MPGGRDFGNAAGNLFFAQRVDKSAGVSYNRDKVAETKFL